MPWYLGNSLQHDLMYRGSLGWSIGFPFLVVWSLVWGALALWHAARRNEKWWFIIFLLIHTVGILEIIYLTFVVHLFSQQKRPTRKSSRKHS